MLSKKGIEDWTKNWWLKLCLQHCAHSLKIEFQFAWVKSHFCRFYEAEQSGVSILNDLVTVPWDHQEIRLHFKGFSYSWNFQLQDDVDLPAVEEEVDEGSCMEEVD